MTIQFHFIIIIIMMIFFVFVSLLCETLPYSCVFDKIRMFVSSDAVKLARCYKRSSGESKISLSMSLNNNNV